MTTSTELVKKIQSYIKSDNPEAEAITQLADLLYEPALVDTTQEWVEAMFRVLLKYSKTIHISDSTQRKIKKNFSQHPDLMVMFEDMAVKKMRNRGNWRFLLQSRADQNDPEVRAGENNSGARAGENVSKSGSRARGYDRGSREHTRPRDRTNNRSRSRSRSRSRYHDDSKALVSASDILMERSPMFNAIVVGITTQVQNKMSEEVNYKFQDLKKQVLLEAENKIISVQESCDKRFDEHDQIIDKHATDINEVKGSNEDLKNTTTELKETTADLKTKNLEHGNAIKEHQDKMAKWDDTHKVLTDGQQHLSQQMAMLMGLFQAAQNPQPVQAQNPQPVQAQNPPQEKQQTSAPKQPAPPSTPAKKRGK